MLVNQEDAILSLTKAFATNLEVVRSTAMLDIDRSSNCGIF